MTADAAEKRETELREIRELRDRLQAACGDRGPCDRIVLFAVLELLDDIIDARASSPEMRLAIVDEVCSMLRAPIAAELAARQRPVS
jgi:hypothetical protein